MAAARGIFGRRDDVGDLATDLRAQGADEAQIAAVLGDMAGDGPPVLPGFLAPVVRLAAAVAGQWRMSGGGLSPLRPVAFDLGAVDVAARWLGIAATPKTFTRLAAIEGEALRLMRTDHG